ncbi:medium-chain acyl-CoA ligase ACSF2, mitochondrial-like [Diadema antillarum]|uniref:medium-chain acyl-CoA ligase ACSF2, mitochondrial-like n=1 Tax=Diadema antillarum TaxID=105358 RepID=UPI003A8C3F25
MMYILLKSEVTVNVGYLILYLSSSGTVPNDDKGGMKGDATYIRVKETCASLSYYKAAEDSSFLRKTIPDVLDENRAKIAPTVTSSSFSSDHVRRTFRQFKDEVDRLALGLVRIGVRHGDRVGIWGPNTLEWLHTQYAVASIGAILVNINAACRPFELHHIMTTAGMKTLVSASSFLTQDYYEMIAEICPSITSSLEGKLQSPQLPDLESVVMYGGAKRPGVYLMDDVMTMGSDDENNKILKECRNRLHCDDPSNMIFTSGTTGLPKGVLTTHFKTVNNIYHTGLRMRLDEIRHTSCAAVPLSHIFGTVIISLAHVLFGLKLVIPSPSFQPGPVIKAINDERCTMFYGVPTMFIALLNHEWINRYDITSVRSIFVGASPIPPETMRRTKDVMGQEELVSAYGITETSPMISLSSPHDSEDQRVNTVGKVLPHLEVKIISPETQKTVPLGSPGEVCVRGYAVMAGYWREEAKTSEVIDDENWYHTGDIGTLDRDGYCRIIGRTKDMIIRGGVNIYPTEIENFIHTHPAVREVQVVGVPDSYMGEEVCAFVQLKPGMETTVEAIKVFCKDKISHYKIPRYIRFVREYPMTVSGKIQKFVLREQWKATAAEE